MEIRHPMHPEQGKTLDTEEFRRDFLVGELFQPGKLNLTYSHFDRIIIGGICPSGNELTLEGGEALGAGSFFERREGGVINKGRFFILAREPKRYPLKAMMLKSRQSSTFFRARPIRPFTTRPYLWKSPMREL